MLLHHPHDPRAVAEFGFDAERGYWVETVFAGNKVVYDATHEDYDALRPLRGALVFLGSFGFLDTGPVSEVLAWLDDGMLDVPPQLRRAVRVARSWLEAAGE